MAERGDRALATGSAASEVDALTEAHELWRGEPLADDDSPDAHALRHRLRKVYEQVLVDRLTTQQELGRVPAGEVLGEVTAMRVAEPLREDLALLKLRALVAAGRPSDALAVYDVLRRQLADELGADPSPTLRALHAELLAEDSPAPRTNVRATLTSFLGREADLSRLEQQLSAHRLVTVAGPGGAGKTHIATKLAGDAAARTPDGVWFVELAPVRDADGIALAELDALGARTVTLLDARDDRPR